MNERRQPSILIVDDEPAVLMSHGIILDRLGYEVTKAGTSDQAFDLVAQRKFDLLICDLSLDGASGLDVIASALRHNAQLPVVLMTGYADTVLPKELADANVTVVTKPTNIPEFLSIVKRLVHRGDGSDETQAAD